MNPLTGRQHAPARGNTAPSKPRLTRQTAAEPEALYFTTLTRMRTAVSFEFTQLEIVVLRHELAIVARQRVVRRSRLQPVRGSS